MSLHTSILKQVLVATDLSTQADHAIERALGLAAVHGAELDIVHVMEEGLPAEAQAEVKVTNENIIRKKLAARPFADKVTVTIDMVVGKAETDIVERCVMSNADCIVLGLHDRLLAENRAIEGTLAETIIGHSKVPVLLVGEEPGGPYRSVVVGMDLSPLSHAAIQAAVLIAPKAALHLVHAYEAETPSGQETARQALESLIAGEKQLFERAALKAGLPEIAVTAITETGDPREVLKAQIAGRSADLLVLATHGRTGLTRTLSGSVTTDLINERLCDVLVIRPEQ
jgi:nucleotide-binding universal stress UspA family protein